MKYRLTSSSEEFISFKGPKINYSWTDFDNSLRISPSGLVFEKSIKTQIISTGSWQDMPVFFITDQGGEINFDLFSAVFYMISRYEEYLPFDPDRYGRFRGTGSFAYRNGFLEIPVVDNWIRKLQKIMAGRFPEINFKSPEFSWISTVDVDNAWAFMNRGKLITFSSLLKSFLSGNEYCERLNVIAGKGKDPYFNFDLLRELHGDDPEKLIFFFLSGRPGGINGRIDPRNKEWQELVRNISGIFRSGIHPSSHAFRDQKVLQKEIRNLNSVTGMSVHLSRQHFLLLKFPLTFRQLIDSGISDDYSMGFADLTGFRAGTSNPFYFYDLEKEEATSLRIWPFAMMDRTLKDYMRSTPEEAFTRITSLIDRIIGAGGIFISLWHNDALGNSGEWKGWRQVYTDMINYLKSRNG